MWDCSNECNHVDETYNYIIYDVDGMRRPVIEKYIQKERQLVDFFIKSKYIETFEFEDMYVHDDYVVCALFEYPQDIFKFKKELIEAFPELSIRVMDEQVEDAIHEDDLELVVDFLINLKIRG